MGCETQPCNAKGEESILILSKYGLNWSFLALTHPIFELDAHTFWRVES
jgi:hypothetical protein